MHTLRRRLLWTAVGLLMIAAGYTVGFLLAPTEPAVVTRTLPEAPLPAEAPPPSLPSTPPDALDEV